MSNSIFEVNWIHGANCTTSGDPPFQVHKFDQDTFVLRQSKCVTFEGNFIYLLFGTEKAILFDSGAQPVSPIAPDPSVRQTVQNIIAQWRANRSQSSIDLIVAHTHSHGDHTFGDSQFVGQMHTTVVKPTLPAVKNFFNLPDWPDGTAAVDLGGREMLILPVPGHEDSHIAAYDSNTRILLTGDTLYPGLLTVKNWTDYRKSAARLANFVTAHPVSLVLGAHVEMKKTPRELYPIGTCFQPDEHALPLGIQHVHEWHQACKAMGNNPHVDVHDDFIISPQGH